FHPRDAAARVGRGSEGADRSRICRTGAPDADRRPQARNQGCSGAARRQFRRPIKFDWLRSLRSQRIERTHEFREQIAPVFGAYRDSHHRIGDAGSGKLLRAEFAVSGGHRMTRESFDTAEAHRILRDLETAQKFKGLWLSTLYIERHQRTRVVGLRVADTDLFAIIE